MKSALAYCGDDSALIGAAFAGNEQENFDHEIPMFLIDL
jgi:hypothetical protein